MVARRAPPAADRLCGASTAAPSEAPPGRPRVDRMARQLAVRHHRLGAPSGGPGAHRGRIPRSRPVRRGRGRASCRPTRRSSRLRQPRAADGITRNRPPTRLGTSLPAPAGGTDRGSRRRDGHRQRGDRRRDLGPLSAARVVVVHNCPPRWGPSTAGVDRIRTALQIRRERRSSCATAVCMRVVVSRRPSKRWPASRTRWLSWSSWATGRWSRGTAPWLDRRVSSTGSTSSMRSSRRPSWSG